MSTEWTKELDELLKSETEISKEKVKLFVRKRADWLSDVAMDALAQATLENLCKRCEEYEACVKNNFTTHLDCFCVLFQRGGQEHIELRKTLEKVLDKTLKKHERPLEDLLYPQIRRIGAFYDALVKVAQKEGYMLDFEKEKAYPCMENGKKISMKELIKQWGHLREVPSGEFYFKYFLKERDDKRQTILKLKERGYDVKFNFYAEDMLHGNIVTKIGDKWFAFGECEQDGNGENIDATEIWPMRYVIANINRLQVQLRYAVEC